MYLEGHIDEGLSPEDFHHHDYDTCDACGKEASGTMIYSTGATGRICAVLFLCRHCDPKAFKRYKDGPHPLVRGL